MIVEIITKRTDGSDGWRRLPGEQRRGLFALATTAEEIADADRTLVRIEVLADGETVYTIKRPYGGKQ